MRSRRRYFLREQVLRKIARSKKWQTIYSISYVMHTNIFNGSLCDWTKDQMNLVEYCAYYHNVLEKYGKPSEHIYENDVLFDNWAMRMEHEQKHVSHGGKSASSHDEIIEFGS